MIIFLNRIPIPTLKHYCLFSFSLFAIVFVYAQKILHDILNQKYANEKLFGAAYVEENGVAMATIKTITHEPWCFWVLINVCYCVLLLASRVIQTIIFGKLRAVENQHIKDHFWNFIFLKFIFIFGVLNSENVNDIIMWSAWFSIIGFLAIHCQICKDRFEYLLFSPNTPLKSHIKVLIFLIFIQACAAGLIGASLYVKSDYGLSICLFMMADALALSLRNFYVIFKYSIHLCDLYKPNQLNHKGTINYYTDLSFEIVIASIEFLHYFHMLIYGNFYLSMASLVICMELKRLFFDLKRRIRKHSNYLRVIEKMEKRFPWATPEELAASEKCAVCWELLDQGRRLPCSHVFHQHCLRSWLEQHTSCPTCRKSLQEEKDNPTAAAAATTNTGNQVQTNQPQGGAATAEPQPQLLQAGGYFQFNGSRYFSWLPSFSIQVTNGANILPFLRTRIDPERLNQMTDQVIRLFPNIPAELIRRDLQRTHSIEFTVENILDDRLNNVNNYNNDNDDGNHLRRSTTNNQNNNNNNIVNNNYNDDSTDENVDEDDDEDSTSSDDDLLMMGIHSNNSNLNITNRTSNRLMSLFNSIDTTAAAAAETNQQSTRSVNNSFSSTSTTTATNGATTTESDQSAATAELAVAAASASADSKIISKYSTSPTLSKNANDLMLKKRELILNSKKRFLEKINQNSSTATTAPAAEAAVEDDSTVQKSHGNIGGDSASGLRHRLVGNE